jgi:CheY-like chemotaxis protein
MIRLNADHRKILLIDQNRTKQNLRATILRNYEIEVHTASSIPEAAALWARHLYDLVLLAAEENSKEAGSVSAEIRRVNPRQRIGLLVGPPVFIRELGGARGAPRRRKVESVRMISPSRSLENPGMPIMASQPPSPQWQEMIGKLVSNWYVESRALLGLSRLNDWAADA